MEQGEQYTQNSFTEFDNSIIDEYEKDFQAPGQYEQLALAGIDHILEEHVVRRYQASLDLISAAESSMETEYFKDARYLVSEHIDSHEMATRRAAGYRKYLVKRGLIEN